MGISEENLKGVILALLSSGFIGSSFIIKKKGLRKAAAASGVRAGVGGYYYLLEPLWWLGMVTMIVGEAANFVAYAFAPAVLVTPLGALSIIVSAILAHLILKEKLHQLGVLGCVMCISGSVVIVLHAPKEHPIESAQEIWTMATQPAFLVYLCSVVVLVFILVFHFAPSCGHTNVLVYTGICSLMGSLSVMSVKALGTSLKLTFEGKNQLIYPETWFFMLVVATCVITQMNYLNKALDTFNTAIVSPIYYVMFTTLTILASVIMFKDWDGQSGATIVSDICGFVIVLSGTILLHATKDFEKSPSFRGSNCASLSPSLSTRLCSGNGESLKHDEENVPSPERCIVCTLCPDLLVFER
ncbi:putative magnesium transporter NIPA6 isoform X1 [Senna tora]|uniref:Probable magnesium transporter n=1 Tax=Senna tora TaxID=362788 RepID=A0A834T5Y7_9FABA|nr:putative magnesium transporter NIPA6 isoform X1 [Senna tora]